MASFSSYSEDLICSICQTIFNDPVILHCGHSFCRECITLSLSSWLHCPQCRAAVSVGGSGLTTNHILKSLAEKAKNTVRPKREQETDKEADGWYCPEHEEKIKLFCVTDQLPACTICRDGEKHNGHTFKPVKEAAAILMEELKVLAESVSKNNLITESSIAEYKEAISESKGKAKQLRDQFRRQFEEMHQFLKKREREIENELKLKEDGVIKKLRINLNRQQNNLSEGRELDKKIKSLMKMTNSERFLKKWTEEKGVHEAKNSLYPYFGVDTFLSLFPYESHLQFFVWKEMLQIIQPREEQLTLKTQSSKLKVSDDGRSLLPPCTQCQSLQRELNTYKTKSLRPFIKLEQDMSVLSTDTFSSGQHFWEIDVGNKSNWEVGIQNNFLKYDGRYSIYEEDISTELSFEGTPTKIGVFLNYSSEELSFYDANNMTLIYTATSCNFCMEKKAFLRIGREQDHTPLTVCWY